MTATRRVLALFLVGGCGQCDQRNNEPPVPPTIDAGVATETSLGLSLDGTDYVLRYGSVRRASKGEPRTWICVSNQPSSFDRCLRGDGSERVTLIAAYLPAKAGGHRWDLASTSLHRIGRGALTRLATSGTIAVVDDNSVRVQLEVSLSFGRDALAGVIAISDHGK